MSQVTVEFAELVRQAQAQADAALSATSFYKHCENCGERCRFTLVAETARQEIYRCASCGYSRFYTVR